MKKSRRFLSFVFLTVILTACNWPGPPQLAQVEPGLRSWIDAPLNGRHLPLAAYEIVYHGSDPGGVAQLELSVDGEVLAKVPNPDPTQYLVTMRFIWEPLAPGNYTLRARTQNTTGAWSEYAVAAITVDEVIASTLTPTPPPSHTPTATFTPTPLPSLTPTLTPSPLPTDTFTPPPTTCLPSATFIKNAHCRHGPGTMYGIMTSLLEGQTVSVEGRKDDSAWWWILLPDVQAHCWVSDTTVETACIPPDLQVIAAPPLAITGVQPSRELIYNSYICELTKVNILANVMDPNGVSSVTLYYRLKNMDTGEAGNWASKMMDFLENNIWGANVDAAVDLPEMQSGPIYALEYYVMATNALGVSLQSQTFTNVQVAFCGE